MGRRATLLASAAAWDVKKEDDLHTPDMEVAGAKFARDAEVIASAPASLGHPPLDMANHLQYPPPLKPFKLAWYMPLQMPYCLVCNLLLKHKYPIMHHRSGHASPTTRGPIPQNILSAAKACLKALVAQFVAAPQAREQYLAPDPANPAPPLPGFPILRGRRCLACAEYGTFLATPLDGEVRRSNTTYAKHRCEASLAEDVWIQHAFYTDSSTRPVYCIVQPGICPDVDIEIADLACVGDVIASIARLSLLVCGVLSVVSLL
jgi:hypothetical protein